MFYGPMFRREYQAATRGRRSYLYRVFIVTLLVLALLPVGLSMFPEAPSGVEDPNRLRVFGRVAFLVTFCGEVLLLVIFVPAFVVGSIAEEREKNTLPLLLLTRLSRLEIVATKMIARWLPATSLVLTGLPFLVVAAYLGGLEFPLVMALLVLISSSLFIATLAILESASREQAATARVQASAWVWGWLLGPPILTIMPIRSATLWGQLLAEVKGICAFLAPSSPLSLATDRSWYYRPEVLDLGDKAARMVGLQVLFGLVAMLFAASRLMTRERNPNWADPTRGHRPPCGDDPIFWREYELPARRGGGTVIGFRLRMVWILIRALLLTTLALFASLLVLALPIVLIFSTIYYGVPAFGERWQFGTNGPFVERARFNLVVRAATAVFVLMPALTMGSIVAGKITTERDKKTWDTLLTTPLGGEEILRSKTRAALYAFGQMAWPVPIVWVLGLICGAVSPLGTILAVVDLLLLLWLNLGLGFSLSLRPGPTSVASSRIALLTLLILVLQLPLIAALLASPPELAAFDSLDRLIRWGAASAGVAVMIVTGLAAWRVTLGTIENFDRWVGRPCDG